MIVSHVVESVTTDPCVHTGCMRVPVLHTNAVVHLPCSQVAMRGVRRIAVMMHRRVRLVLIVGKRIFVLA